jgi:hypothetical protein
MANSLSSLTAGVGGVQISSVDTSGSLDIKSGTTTIVSITSAGAAITGALSATGAVTASNLQGPAFRAYQSVGGVTTLPAGVYTKVLFDTEDFDTNSNFASSAFTPTVAGYYQVNLSVTYAAFQTGEAVLAIYKNGSAYQYLSDSINTRLYTFGSSLLISMNGSSDYLEVYVYNGNAGSTTTVGGSSLGTAFSASMVRSS